MAAEPSSSTASKDAEMQMLEKKEQTKQAQDRNRAREKDSNDMANLRFGNGK